MPHPQIDLKKVRTYPIAQRCNLVKLSDLIYPHRCHPNFENPDLAEVAKAGKAIG